MQIDDRSGVWKSGRGKGRGTPKGRQLDDQALAEVCDLIGDRPRRRDLLIEFLHLIQDAYGCLSAAHLRALAEEMRLAQTEVYEVASFYAHFDVVKEGEDVPPAITIRVCESLSCELAGAQKLLSDLVAAYGGSGEVRVLSAPCMGRCDTAPALEIGHNHIDHATPALVDLAIAAKDFDHRTPDYQRLEAYQADGGYEELEALRGCSRTPDEVQDAILESGLRGLGGAGFPSGKKWSFVRAEDGPRYLAVNGDEGEPGTFKDRHYLEREPHVFLEGMLIAAWAVEAETCFIYMRDEYPAVLQILRDEIAKLEAAGIVTSGYIDLRRGAGAYICGEESAMIESIEGKRGRPRHRPPFVAQVGVFNRPTLVHNVETLYWISKVARFGPEVLNVHEKNGRKGLRSYSISGRVKSPGV
ncbi:MAG: NAD(P)H-dependent oxidoreductase subunit E, partial [Pseudomonadota bacterium]